jgi:hypothetical protein
VELREEEDEDVAALLVLLCSGSWTERKKASAAVASLVLAELGDDGVRGAELSCPRPWWLDVEEKQREGKPTWRRRARTRVRGRRCRCL